MADVWSTLFSKMPIPPLLPLHEIPTLVPTAAVPPAGRTYLLVLQLLNSHTAQNTRQWSCCGLQSCSAQPSCSEKSGWEPAKGSQGEWLFVEHVSLIPSPTHSREKQ